MGVSMSSKQKWPIVLIIAATIGALTFPTLWALYLSPYAQHARKAGFDPPTFVVVRTLQERASRQRSLSFVEVATLGRLSADNNPLIRARALTALFYIGGTDQAPAAADIARGRVKDESGMVRAYALSALARLGAPDTARVARRMLDDPNESVRAKARKVLGLP